MEVAVAPTIDVSSVVYISADTPPPNKKLRISSDSRTNVITSLSTLTSQLADVQGNDALQILIKASDALKFDAPDISGSFVHLSDHFRRDKESAVRVKILSLLSAMCLQSTLDGAFAIEEISRLLRTENSSKVISQGLYSLYKIASCQSGAQCQNRAVQVAKQQMLSASHNVQRHALQVLAAYATLSDIETEVLDFVACYTDSQDCRVRAEAFHSIVVFRQRGVSLTPQSLYHRTVNALRDDYECVRRDALELIYELSIEKPDFMIESNGGNVMRMVDAAFGHICSALCDLSMQLRQQAAQFLGGLTMVSDEYLHQTLDKKLMSNLRRKRSLHERAEKHYASGEWSTGKKWSDDAPKEKVNTTTVSLMSSGACGAFVHGLEDEFLEVRTATVDSMCRLALNNAQFALTSLDFLVDMFNDEIEDVRLQAISALTKIARHICLREDQLEIMLSSLEDFSVEVREGLHQMLGACRVSTQSCLSMVVQKILDVLRIYPQDKYSAYGCMQRLGLKHSALCMSMTPMWLEDHPFFDRTEKDVENPHYVCILILIFNGSRHLPPMLSLLPEKTIKHYAYLRDTMPEFVPHLKIVKEALTIEGATGSRQFLETLLNNVKSSYSTTHARRALLAAAQENLGRLSLIDPSLCGTANFVSLFLGAQLLTEQMQHFLHVDDSTPAKESLTKLTEICFKLQHLFSGLTTNDILLVKQIRLRSSAVQLLHVVRDRSQSALAPSQSLQNMVAEMVKFLEANKIVVADAFTQELLKKMKNFHDPKPGRIFREILPLCTTALPIATPEINMDIRMCRAKILDPNNTTADEVINVTAGLIAAVPFHAVLTGLQDAQRNQIRISIRYPDQNVHCVVPRFSDLKRYTLEDDPELGNDCRDTWRLRTTVLLSHAIWTESANVELSLCLAVPGGNHVDLGKSVKVVFAPKPVKRGI